MRNIFNTVTTISSVSLMFARWFLSIAMFIGFWGVITATSIFGFYFIGQGIVATFSIFAVAAAIAFVIWSVGFIWKVKRLFFPKVEPIVDTPAQ